MTGGSRAHDVFTEYNIYYFTGKDFTRKFY